MSRIEKGDLQSANDAFNTLEDITSVIGDLKGKITNFEASANTYMKSNTMTAISRRLELYQHSIDMFEQLLPNIKSSVTAANNAMTGFMDSYSYLDTSELNKLKEELTVISRKIEEAKAAIAETKKVPHYDNWDKEKKYPTYYTEEYVLSAEQRRWMQFTIDCEGGWKKQKEEIERHIEKLEQLDGAASGAWGGIEATTGSIDTFIKYVSSIN